jgi:hypothetical protein
MPLKLAGRMLHFGKDAKATTNFSRKKAQKLQNNF